MLTQEDTELLCRIGPGTPMGALMRQYWVPVMLSQELPEPDGDPLRVRLLGEDLVIFRDTRGRVGLLEEACSHRGASLYFGRNEEGGLRCVYHGWTYDAEGRCVDMPNEPATSNFKDKIRHPAYPCREAGGMIWTYMGPRKDPPPLPELEWTQVPASHLQISPFLRACNWAQALEGDIDTTHSGFLHSQLDRHVSVTNTFRRENPPRLEVVLTPYGAMYAGQYGELSEPDAGTAARNTYWRVSLFMFPFHTLFPMRPDGMVPGHIWVPLDDHHTMVWALGWHPLRPLESPGMARAMTGGLVGDFLPDTSDGLGRWRPEANKTNDYALDRRKQRRESFSGIPTIPLQDQAVTESMGPIMNRTKEHLGTADSMIIQVRRRLLSAAKALRDQGEVPPGVDNPEWYRVRSVAATLPVEANWMEELGPWMAAESSTIPEAAVRLSR